MSQQKSKSIEEIQSDEEFQKRLAELTPEQTEMFMNALELTIRKRRLMLIGYVATMLLAVAGSIVALFVYVGREPGQFRGWVFLMPFLAAGVSMVFFGRAVRRAKPKKS